LSASADVTALVRRAHALRSGAQALESALFGAAAALLVETAALLTKSGGPAAWPVAFLMGVLAGVTWWLERHVAPADTARELDRRIGGEGALRTAFELERRGRELAPLERLVQVRALARVPPTGLRRLFRPAPVALGAALGAALLWIVVVDVARGLPGSQPTSGDPARLSDALAGALGSVEAELAASAGPGNASAPSSAALARSAAELERSLAEGDRAAAQRAIETLDRELMALERHPAGDGGLRERAREARGWLDALRGALDPAGSVARAGAGAAPDALTRDGSDGRMAGSSGTPDTPPMVSATPPLPPLPVPAPARAAVPDVRVWPLEYRDVVSRWIELRRAALADEG